MATGAHDAGRIAEPAAQQRVLRGERIIPAKVDHHGQAPQPGSPTHEPSTWASRYLPGSTPASTSEWPPPATATTPASPQVRNARRDNAAMGSCQNATDCRLYIVRRSAEASGGTLTLARSPAGAARG